MHRSIAALAVLLLATAAYPAAAADTQDYFIPGQAKPQTGGTAPRPAQKPQQRPATSAPVQIAPAGQPQAGGLAGGGGEGQEQGPVMNIQMPPPPDLPPLPKGEAPPVPVIGVMGVPEVMRTSAAGLQVEKIIGERRAKLNEDAQKEQAAWREMQQALANERGKLSPDQLRAREKELQDRITNAQRQFRDRNRIIQEAAQYALAQIERTLIAVIRQVADARGMNLVLHRSQVALNVNQFDITEQVAEQLNKILPTVLIPPDGVSPNSLPADVRAQAAAAPAAAAAAAAGAAPAAAAPAAATPAAAVPAAPAK